MRIRVVSDHRKFWDLESTATMYYWRSNTTKIATKYRYSGVANMCPRRSWKYFQSIIGLWTVRDLWWSMALFSRIFSMCLRLWGLWPQTLTGLCPWTPLGGPPDSIFCPPLANSWLRPCTVTQGWGVTKYKYFVTILCYFFEYFVM